jgi:hypothetical protein
MTTISSTTKKESLYKIKEICAIKYNPSTLPQAVQKCKQLLSTMKDQRCLCSVIPSIIQLNSNELSTKAISMCKAGCQLCQIKMNNLFDLTKSLPFHITQRMIPLKNLEKRNLLFILEHHLHEINESYVQDVIENLFANITEKNRQSVLQQLTAIIHKHIHANRKSKKNTMFILFYEIIKYVNMVKQSHMDSYDETESHMNFVEHVVTHIMVVIQSIVEYNLLDQLEINKIIDLVFFHFQKFKLTVQEGFKKWCIASTTEMTVLTSEKDVRYFKEGDQWILNRKAAFQAMGLTRAFIRKILLEYDRPISHMNSHMLAFVFQLSSDDMTAIMRKTTANCLTHIISKYLAVDSNDEFDLHVDPSHMINSTICKNMNLSGTMSQFTHLNRKPYIIYENENGKLGVDAGGLTRDFFSQYFLQLKQEVMVPIDDIYMTFPAELRGVNSLARIRFAGVLMGHSMLREKIPPNFRFHPIIPYFMVNGSTIQINDLLDYLAKYDIDYIQYLRKVLNYSPDEFKEYLDMQGEEDLNVRPTEYLRNVIQERYMTPGLIAFVRGFRDIFLKLEIIDLFSIITPEIIYSYMLGMESYRIFGSENSLESILKIDFGEKDADISVAKKRGIKQVFLEVLDELNRGDFAKLKGFMRFWHGTHAIQDFRHLDLTFRVLDGKDDLYGCFASSTCFGKLYIHHKHVCSVSPGVLKDNLISHLEKTLENQRLVESAGMFMQVD